MLRLIIALGLLLTPRIAGAITLLPPCTATGDCGITDILGAALNFAEILLGISGAVALLMFVVGGFKFVLAGMRPDWAKEGIDTIRNAVIGILIIFLSGLLVRFTQSALTGRADSLCTKSDRDAGQCIAVVGDSCQPSDDEGRGGALWIQVPGGYQNAADPVGTAIPESIECVPKDDCGSLNGLLTRRNRKEHYTCMDPGSPGAGSCIHGLCNQPGTACCL